MTGIAALILYKKEIDMIVNPPRDALTSRYDFVHYHVTGEGKDNLVDKEVAHKIVQRSYYEKFLKAARAEERMLKQMMDRLFLLGETGDCPFDVRTLDVLIEEMFL